MIPTVGALVEKMDNIQTQMGNVIREMEIVRKNQTMGSEGKVRASERVPSIDLSVGGGRGGAG